MGRFFCEVIVINDRAKTEVPGVKTPYDRQRYGTSKLVPLLQRFGHGGVRGAACRVLAARVNPCPVTKIRRGGVRSGGRPALNWEFEAGGSRRWAYGGLKIYVRERKQTDRMSRRIPRQHDEQTHL